MPLLNSHSGVGGQGRREVTNRPCPGRLHRDPGGPGPQGQRTPLDLCSSRPLVVTDRRGHAVAQYDVACFQVSAH